jgi:hypothetical protein
MRHRWDLERGKLEGRYRELAEGRDRASTCSQGGRDRNDVRDREGESADGREREGNAAAAQAQQAERVSGECC